MVNAKAFLALKKQGKSNTVWCIPVSYLQTTLLSRPHFTALHSFIAPLPNCSLWASELRWVFFFWWRADGVIYGLLSRIQCLLLGKSRRRNGTTFIQLRPSNVWAECALLGARCSSSILLKQASQGTLLDVSLSWFGTGPLSLLPLLPPPPLLSRFVLDLRRVVALPLVFLLSWCSEFYFFSFYFYEQNVFIYLAFWLDICPKGVLWWHRG